MGIELKEIISQKDMTELMDRAFSDLRADYELSIDVSREKICQLAETNVDVDNHLQNLIAYSTHSSGIVSGLRGTGKTHLMLLARNAINEKLLGSSGNGAFCVYLNAKRFTMPVGEQSEELFNRAFSLFLYDAFALQLKALLEELAKRLEEETLKEKLLNFLFSGNKQKLAESMEAAVKKLLEFKAIVRKGTEELRGLSAGLVTEESFEKELTELAVELERKVGGKHGGLSAALAGGLSGEISEKVAKSKDQLTYLSHATVRTQLTEAMKLVGIRSLVFYIDEWEKLYGTDRLQEHMAAYLNRIMDDPIYVWIGMVPNRSSTGPLSIGADLPHTIDLDESLIYESSPADRAKCMDYFTRFINKRLAYYFRDTPYARSITVDTLFNTAANLELLVLASMGNSRDFGAMLAHCWSEFQTQRKSGKRGRPFKYISKTMVIKSIRYSGDQKRQNIAADAGTKAVWEDVEAFCIAKRSSHFMMEESPECMECLDQREFSNLIYHRLLHFRKAHLTQKDGGKEQRLSLYALDYASIYNLLSDRKEKIEFITDAAAIHNSVRRYVYDPRSVVKKLRIQSGRVVYCKSCGGQIDLTRMQAAWEKNFCPFCGGTIYDR